jgi:hypothetical protein
MTVSSRSRVSFLFIEYPPVYYTYIIYNRQYVLSILFAGEPLLPMKKQGKSGMGVITKKKIKSIRWDEPRSTGDQESRVLHPPAVTQEKTRAFPAHRAGC